MKAKGQDEGDKEEEKHGEEKLRNSISESLDHTTGEREEQIDTMTRQGHRDRQTEPQNKQQN